MTNQIQIFLGTQPRLLREMLQLALTQLLDNAEVRTVDMSELNAGSEYEDDAVEWLIISAENSDTAEKQARTLLNRRPNLMVAAMANDARSLNVYSQRSGGDVRQSAYSDFSLAQFVDILKRAGS